ncbi:trypco2 family protein [Paracoccus sp. (in: a-proteobacteria)]|uniref:trypco2 family protein n=1 Tax=Paracoccus sp. TaxID=267 RepID=UPI002AFF5A8E|nr:trypco2 family protein [Paracoccus sp. (in: a-proteobacteria)]
MQDYQGHLYTAVEFDMAVTVTAEVEGKGGLRIPYFEASGGAIRSNEAVSRVKFSIPFRFSGA